MSREDIREARLVAVSINGLNAGFAASTALSGDDDGVAHAPVGQPARAAVVQAVAPGCVELSRGGQLRAVTHAVRFGLPEGETLRGGAVEHLTL